MILTDKEEWKRRVQSDEHPLADSFKLFCTDSSFDFEGNFYRCITRALHDDNEQNIKRIRPGDILYKIEEVRAVSEDGTVGTGYKIRYVRDTK